MIAYKGLLPGLTYRGYQFRVGFNVMGKANCVHSGFHRAEDPLDCLHYYGDINHTECYIVDASGGIDEDGVGSKISCIELTILKRLTKKELLPHGFTFMASHPKWEWNSNIKVGKAEAWNGYAAVRGADPIAKGTRNGDVPVFAKEDGTISGIRQIVVVEIDGKTLQPGIWYGVESEKRMVN